MINANVEEHDHDECECSSPQIVNIKLTVNDVHNLLNILEFGTTIINRNKTNAVNLWENISDQLDPTIKHVIYGSERHRQLEPEKFLKQNNYVEKQEDCNTNIGILGKFFNVLTFGWWKKFLMKGNIK